MTVLQLKKGHPGNVNKAKIDHCGELQDGISLANVMRRDEITFEGSEERAWTHMHERMQNPPLSIK